MQPRILTTIRLWRIGGKIHGFGGQCTHFCTPEKWGHPRVPTWIYSTRIWISRRNLTKWHVASPSCTVSRAFEACWSSHFPGARTLAPYAPEPNYHTYQPKTFFLGQQDLQHLFSDNALVMLASRASVRFLCYKVHK